MRIVKVEKAESTLILSAEEIATINNAMNEALEALAADPDEFHTRVGATVPAAKELLASINAVVRQMAA